ncbi:hypothetical protein BGC33_05690 [Bathymodiolus thermophilus thioautotrophic gill symbiont]|uniref:Uncharacterized protein n=1 Tax=Bathymodiolus thermophilus thioautotrophic gill symbiont TaxID=2360 RepID=A0A1J5TWQ0_9GAMM|nr:hypothetical protein BGC33_05690 [Bathymodiolus thermophilus thioautotrophic gill symbiont]
MMYLTDKGLKEDKVKSAYWTNKSFSNFKIIECGKWLPIFYIQNKNYNKAYEIYSQLKYLNNHAILNSLGTFHKKGIILLQKSI